jgi:hypothetical protein
MDPEPDRLAHLAPPGPMHASAGFGVVAVVKLGRLEALGMTPEQMGKLFQEFSQASSAHRPG